MAKQKATAVQAAEDSLWMLLKKKKSQSPDPIVFEEFYPVDLELLVPEVGWTLERVTSPSIVGGGPTWDRSDAHADFDTRRIYLDVSKGLSEGRIRFSLAHEIGHVVLHEKKHVGVQIRTRPIREKYTDAPLLQRKWDAEANRFAIELLMPPKAVQRRFTELFNCSQIFYDSSIRKLNNRRSFAESIATKTDDPSKPALSDFFKVSRSAMGIRLIELRLVL